MPDNEHKMTEVEYELRRHVLRICKYLEDYCTDEEDTERCGKELVALSGICPRCEGFGVEADESGEELCPKCKGSGMTEATPPGSARPCPFCGTAPVFSGEPEPRLDRRYFVYPRPCGCHNLEVYAGSWRFKQAGSPEDWSKRAIAHAIEIWNASFTPDHTVNHL